MIRIRTTCARCFCIIGIRRICRRRRPGVHSQRHRTKERDRAESCFHSCHVHVSFSLLGCVCVLKVRDSVKRRSRSRQSRWRARRRAAGSEPISSLISPLVLNLLKVYETYFITPFPVRSRGRRWFLCQTYPSCADARPRKRASAANRLTAIAAFRPHPGMKLRLARCGLSVAPCGFRRFARHETRLRRTRKAACVGSQKNLHSPFRDCSCRAKPVFVSDGR